ncbi:MAG TPA: hypothetical protein VNR40_14335 [Steroidobacter sp.]|nr:hypothetical protein [Steroidobacter sp.]
MKAAQRKVLLGGLLAVTVILIVMAPPAEDETVGVVDRSARAETMAGRAAVLEQERATESARKYRVDVPAVFAPTDWSPPRRVSAAPAAMPVEQPVEPQVPPVPFRVLGRFVENGVPGMFVQLNERTLVARAGDFIGDLYRVESVSDQTMTVVYLPLKATQTVNAGAAP